MIWIKRVLLLLFVLFIAAAIVYAFLPQPVRVDVGTVEDGPLEVAVRDDGMTRLRERYVVSTPISGRLRRIELKVGDTIVAGETVLARMEPTAPELLDPRNLAQAQARVRAAEGRRSRAKSDLERAKANLEQAEVEHQRQTKLYAEGAGTESRLEEAQLRVRTMTEELRSAEYQTEIAQYELELERAALLHFSKETENGDMHLDFEIHAPISGRVLRVMQESSAVLAAGAPLLELGDPSDLEVVVDVLSSDAVRIRPGQRVLLEHWGGSEPLHASVRLVEPSGFTKVSALGVEEQRVNVIIDFAGSIGVRPTLGDGYRVEARIIVWEEERTLKVPSGALFRSEGEWAVFVMSDNRAELRRVTIGRNNGLEAQVLDGLRSGDRVVLYPSDQVADGTPIEPRQP